MNHHLKLASADHRQEGQALSQQLSQKNLRGLLASQQASSFKVLKQGHQVPTSGRPESTKPYDRDGQDSEAVVFLDSRGQPLPKDLNGALLALNALLDQSKMTPSARTAGERAARMIDAGSLEKILGHQTNLLRAIEEHVRVTNEQAAEQRTQGAVCPLLKAHLRNLIHLTFKRKLFSLQVLLEEPREQIGDLSALCMKISVHQARLFKQILERFCPWRSSAVREDTESSAANLSQYNEKAQSEKSRQSSLVLAIVEYFSPFVQHIQPTLKDVRKREEAMMCLMVLLKLLSSSEKLRQAAIQKDLVVELFKMLPSLLASATRPTSADFQKQLENSAFFICHFANMDADNKAKSATQRHLHHLQLTSSTRHNQMVLEQQHLQSHSYSQPQNKKVTPQQRKSGQHNHLGFNLNLQEVLAGPRLMTGDRYLESGGGLSGGPMSGPSGLGISGKTHGHHQNQQYSNLDTSGIRNHFYRNGPGTSSGGMYGGVAAGAPGTGHVNNSALPPMSTSQSRRFTQMTQQNAVSIGHTAGHHNKSLDGYRKRIQDSSQSPVRRLQGNNAANEFDGGDMNTAESRQGVVSGVPGLLGVGGMVGAQADATGGQPEGVGMQQQRQNIHRRTHINKQSFVRAASEPPHPGKSLNSKSIILPVQEENENRIDDDGPPSGVDGHEGLEEAGNGMAQNMRDQEAICKTDLKRDRDRGHDQNQRDQDRHLNQQVMEFDFVPQQNNRQVGNQNAEQDENEDSPELGSAPPDGGRRDSSAFVMNSFLGPGGVQGPAGVGQPNGPPQAHLSAFSGQASQLSNLENPLQENHLQMEMQPPMSAIGSAENADRINHGYPALVQQNQQDMGKLSRRQLSYGQGQNDMSRERTNKLQTASNQVIAAYGDPRDQRFTPPAPQAQPGQRTSNVGPPSGTGSQNKLDLPQNVSLSDEDSSEQHRDSGAESEGPSEQIQSENLDTVKDTQKPPSAASRSPLIPKLNLVQIKQDSMLGRHRIETSIGHQNILGTAGAPSLMATPGQHQNLNSVALVQAPAPLTSHYPVITSCSPDKRGGDQILYCMDTSNRTSAIIPIHVGAGGHPRILTSFTNAVGSNPHLISTESVNEFRMDHSGGHIGLPGGGLLSRGGAGGPQGRYWKHTANSSKLNKPAQSFKQQRNNMILKLKQFHTQHTQNNSDMNRGPGFEGEAEQKEPDQDHEQLSDPQLNALISEANATNVSAGGTTTNNNRSNSLKMLDGMASSTLNPFGGTQASNLVGMRDFDGAGGLGAGVGGAGGAILNMGGYNGLGSLYGAYGAYGAGVAGGALLVPSPEGQGCFQGDATRSVHDLGRQLGESYLAKDLACLLTQQRDMELQNEAEQAVLSQGQRWPEAKPMLAASKLEPATRSKSMIVSQEVLRSNRQSEWKTPVAAERAPAGARHAFAGQTSRASPEDFLRTLALNILVLLLDSYPAAQLRLLNSTMLLRGLLSFMQSNIFQLPVMQQAIDGVQQAQQLRWLLEQNAKSQPANWLSSATRAIGAAQRGLIAVSYKQAIDEASNDELVAGRRALSIHSEAAAGEVVMLDDPEAVLALLQKFQFANEDIMRRYVHSQFASFIDKQKPGLVVAVEQACRTEAGGQAFDLTSPQASQKKTQLENDKERKLQTLDEDSEEQFRLSRAQALKFQEQLTNGLKQHGLSVEDLLADPNLLVGNNGVTYDVTQAQAVPLASKGMCIPKEVIRRKLDIVLYVISKQIKNIIVKQAQEALCSANTPPPSAMGPMASSPDLNWLDPSFAQKLTKMIVVLSSYLEGQSQQSSRVLLSQVIDVVLEPLMMVKRLLADVVLRQKIFEHDPTRPIVAFVQQELIQKGLVVDDQLIIQEDNRSKSPPAGGNRNVPADQDPGQHPHQSQQPADASFHNQHHGLQAEVQMQIQFAANQMVFRHLFAEFLKLLRAILKLPQNCDSLKLLNEVFVGNSTWQSSVENYSKCLCLQDIVSPILVDLHRRHGQQLTVDQRCLIYENLEGLRGINFLSFDQKHFASQIQFIDSQAAIMLGHSIELRGICESQTQLLSLYLCEALQYHKAMMKFLKTALDIFFPNFQQQQRSNQQMKQAPNGLGGRGPPEKLHCSSFLNRMSHLNNPSRATMYQPNNNVSRGGIINTQTSRNIHQQMDSSFYSGMGGPNNPQQANHLGNSNARNLSPADFPYCQQSQCQNNKMDTTAAAPPAAQMSTENIFSMKSLSTEQKYWKHAVRRALNQISFWIHEESSSTSNLDTHGRALLNQYMDMNSTRYKCIKKSADDADSYVCPVNFCVTAAALDFLKHVFDLNEKFTKYMPIDEVLVVYARTHHTSFVRLYNQNKKHLNALQKVSKASSAAGRKDLGKEGPDSGRRDLLNVANKQGAGEEGSAEVLKLQLNYLNSLRLCKLHLKCLYALARTRTEDTRRKLHHFQLFSFLAQELNLENEYLAKRKKFLNISKRVAKEANEADSFEIEEVNSPTLASRRRGMGAGQQPRGFAVGPAGNNPAAEEEPQSFQREQGYILDPAKAYEAQDPNGTINKEIQRRIDDSLKMESQKAQAVVAEEAEELGKEANSSDSDLGLPPPLPVQKPKPIKGFVPSLRIGGLGISTIAPDGAGGKTAEQLADMQVLQDQQKAKEEQVEDQLSDSDSDTGLPPPPMSNPQSSLKMKLAIPNLKITGLGMSTLSKTANGLTAEQLADQELLSNAKLNAGSATKSNIGRRTSQAKQIMNQPNQLHDIRSETEIESFSNIQESVNSKKAASQKSATSTNIKMQQAGSENSESDSDDGLPPPLPQNKGTALSLPKLQIKGLGISTLANAENGGRTAEQEADFQILKEQKKAAVQKHQEQDSDSGHSESGSSDGLPPPLPVQKPQGFVMPKLAVGGLGLSTLAKNNGKTAEQEADENMLKQQAAPKEGPATSHSRTSRSDSDDGLPPPVPVSKPNFALPKLQIGGLGLSTIAKTADGKTAEALADLELLKQSKAQQMQKIDESDSAQSNSSQEQQDGKATNKSSSSDSDEGLPPPLPPQGGPLKLGIPKLAIGGLGLSTLSNAQNAKTAEQMADLELLQQQQKQPAPGTKQKPDEEETSDSDSDLGLPPPIPMSSNASKFLPKLRIGGLGLSTLAKNDGGPTAEQMADMQVLNNAKKPKKNLDQSDSSATSRSLAQSVGQPRTQAANADPAKSESDSDLGLPPALPPKPPGQLPGFKMPTLSLGGLGLSTLKKDGENMTQEEMADAQQLQQQRAAAQQESEDEEDLSSDEQYYRELERIKAEGQASMSQNQSNQLEGGSRSDEDEDVHAREGMPLEKQQAQPQHFKTIDQHEPDAMFSQANSNVLSAKQSAEKGQMGAQMVQQSRHAEFQGQPNAALPQHPGQGQNAKRTIKQKQIKINPIKLNIFGRGTGGAPAGNPDGHAKVPMKVINKAVVQKAATISNQGSGNLSQQLNIKQNQVKLLKVSQRNQAVMQNKSQHSAKHADDMEEPSSSRDPHQMPGEMSSGAMRPPIPSGSESHHQEWNDRQVDDFLEARKQIHPHGITASDQKPLRPQRPLVDESLLIKATKSTNDPHNQGRNAKNVNFANQQSTNPAQENLKMIFETDEAILDTNLRKKNDNFNRHLSSNFSDLKEEPKLPQEWSRSFSIHEQQPQTFLPRGQLQKTKTFKSKKKRAIRISKDDFYGIEREKRPLYHDEELHRLMLSLILCLLLQPQRGTLDDLYCHQYPINNGKQNYLYILHQHIAYEKNQYVIEGLLSEMNRISPPLAGQRLLKLMCPQLFDLKLYNNGKEWKKLAEGAYGTVYECKTNLIQPKSVAIKQMGLPSDIFDRCVLHDIFTEITCLEEFRLEKCVTDLFDYGVDSQSYYIVMKKYTCSLGEWRRRQGNSIEVFQKNLRLYVSIYNKVLKSLRTIHSHNVTHYDIKCDNVLISFIGDEDEADDGTERPGATDRTKKARDLTNLTDEDFEITIGDFGECKIFSNDKDEFCTRNRGTDCIKSPEMLQLTIHTRKDHDKYDRRKQVGTNRLSDIWSVGCLFYELCTGEFLLYEPDVAYFYVRVVQHQQELITKEKLEKIDCNQYIKDFLKFILIRDQRLRPTIDKVIKRFELIHAIVCNLSEADLPNERGNSQAPHALHNNGGFPQLPASMVIKSNTELQECLHKASWITQTNRLVPHLNNAAPQEQTRLTRILEGVFMCSAGYIKERGNIGAALHSGITHVVISRSAAVQSLRNKFELLEIDTLADDETLNPFKSTPILMDFLRRVTLYKGRVLFVENRDDNFIKECLLIAFAHIFKTNIFETYTLVKSQSLFFEIEASRLGVISEWNMQAQKIRQYLTTFPQFSCHCGASLIILERSFAQYQNMQRIVSCNCPQKVNKLDKSSYLHLPDLSEMEASPKNGYQTCPCAASPYVSCSEHLEFLDRYYFAGRGSNGTHITQSPLNTQQSQLLWAYLDAQDFVLCPDAHQVHFAQDKPDPTTKSLESRRSQASSSRKSRPIPKVPSIPIGQAISHQKGRSGLPGPGSNAGVGYGHQPPTQAENQTPSNRGQAPRFSKYERHIVSNLSQSLQVNGVPVVTPQKVKAFWAHVKELRLAYVQRLQEMEAHQAAASPDATPSPALAGGVPHGLAALRNGRGLASGTSLLSNTPEPNSSRQLKNLISRGANNVGNQAVPPGQPVGLEQQEMHAQMMAALQETPKGARLPGADGGGWDLRKCSVCQCWTHAYHAGFNKYAVLLNNRLSSHNHGLLSQWTGTSAHQGASAGGSGALSGLGMTCNLDQLERQFLLVREEYLKRLQLVEEQQLQLQNFNGGTASASRAAPGPLMGPLPLRSAAERVGGSMFSNFQKNTPAARPSVDRVGMESFTYGINESVMLSSSVGVNRISSNQGRHITSLALGRTEDPAYAPSGIAGHVHQEGVRVPVLEHLAIQLPF